jgi:putative cell wall-binding protein
MHRGVSIVSHRGIKTLVIIVVLAGLMFPASATAAGTISGSVGVYGAPIGIEGVRDKMFEETFGGLSPDDRTLTLPTGAYSVNGGGFGYDTYRMRYSKFGWITQDHDSVSAPSVLHVGLHPDLERTERVAGPDRYSAAVAFARERFTSPDNPDGWWDTRRVVIASGEDRAAADPLAAAGLCGVYDAPLFLVTSTGVPNEVKQAMNEIGKSWDGLSVVVVGGPETIPDSVAQEVADASGGAAGVPDRIIATGDRYDLAAAIAERIVAVSGNPGTALVANGADSDKFFDALALSPLSASEDVPILLVQEDGIPSATRNALNQLGNPDIIIGGGPATVSNEVQNSLDQSYGTVERWSGPDRYATAVAIAQEAVPGWVSNDGVVVVSKLPDALSGGAAIGQDRGLLLITQGDTLTGVTGNYLSANKAAIDKCYVLGGTASVTEPVKTAISNKLQ